VQDDICTGLQRALQQRSSEGVVDDEERLAGEIATEHRHVGHLDRWIGR
jgi:hypothetical protein